MIDAAPALPAHAAEPVRGVGFWGGLSANLLNMIGIGPFITIPLALAAMGGPQAMLGWVAGAVLCMLDGMVWAELGSALPQSGGSYHYLRQAFGPARLGSLFGFIFLWQSLLLGPVNVAAATVGFAHYATYLVPWLLPWHLVALAGLICIVNTALLYRDIGSVQRLSLLVSLVVVAACLWVGVSGALHFDARMAFDFPSGAFDAGRGGFWLGLGSATLIAVYDYGGYNNVCMLGGEIRAPQRTIPRAVLVSIPLVAALYMGLNMAILGSMPWRQAQESQAVIAEFMEVVYGRWGGNVAAILILITGWGGALAVLLGYSRIPYAAAAEGDFFRIFARLHKKGGFPSVSLLMMGGLSALACVVTLSDLIDATIVIQAMFQFIAQCVAVVMLRRRAPDPQEGTFRMPLYPVPLIVTGAGWLYIVCTSPPRLIVLAIIVLMSGAGAFLARARLRRTWPFGARLIHDPFPDIEE